ncbi:Aspartyl/glutamyl-tRNA(Asn/Gln) amidotransferase subunit B [Hibiscus syriacus]|uniref:Aspartyl/glutamyl-tRNA(Asn/Gln) amidotransferase subunit B n=2 Tax=Hibiscus syriacus TaxID=106335 RepID=A0A6A3CM00_HIBSY|nr:Aspartyl/glutamyl-tRNA(Asn/Gln) amidotransferase subunit B [Hibiscus syriacus]
MGCFFQCLGVRNDRPRPHLVSTFSKSTDGAVSRDRLSSVFIEDEKGDTSSNDLESPQIGKGLKDEAKFLKACGTIQETPVEIRKASQKFKQSPPSGGDSETSKFRSWLPNTSIDKFQLDKQSDQPPTPNKVFEALERSDSPENTPSSCISTAANTGMPSMCSTESSEAMTADKTVNIDAFSSSVYGRNKSVRFECESDASSSKSENPEKLELLGYLSASKYSPNPTPLKLSDEMQTPGTVFPSNMKTLANGKTRIRSEYVHSVFNPVGNASLLNAMKEEEPFSSKEMFDELKESPQRIESAIPRLEVGVKQSSLVKDSEVEEGLSSWLKPKHNAVVDPNKNLHVTFSKTPHISKTPGDRPIIGLVAAHWKEDESSRISPKWWDGNGNPNSTTKYKEDQKVSWHATPFEERLEKALSDETFISQRKQVDKPRIHLDEDDESDTALSQLRPSSHSKSVVSF